MRYVSFEDRPVIDTVKATQEIAELKQNLSYSVANSVSSLASLIQEGLRFDLLVAKQAPPDIQPTLPPSSYPDGSSTEPIDMGPPSIPQEQPPAADPNNFPIPTSTPMPGIPTAIPQPTTYTPSKTPTTPLPKATNPPKPTKVPKPTKIPLLKLEARRPGNSFDEVIRTLSPIMCVPEPMLRATLENEYGAWISKVEADWDNRNTFPGSDNTAVSGGTTVMGVMQMMQDTWFRIKPYVMQKFTVSDMSLETTFDAIAGSAYHLRNVSLAGQDKQPCDDWSVKYILYAACRYNGACPANTFGSSQYYNSYTYSVCEAYNRFTKGPKKTCK